MRHLPTASSLAARAAATSMNGLRIVRGPLTRERSADCLRADRFVKSDGVGSAMAYESAKRCLANAKTLVERAAARRAAISRGMPRNEIAEFLD